jgi:ribosome-dependent ATPase
VEKLAFAVYDQDQTPQSRAYLEAFRSSLLCRTSPHPRHERTAPAPATPEIKLALEIPPGFGRDLYAGRQPAVAAWLDGGMPFRAETSRNYVEAVHQPVLERLAEQSSRARNAPQRPNWKPDFATTRTWSASTPSAPG